SIGRVIPPLDDVGLVPELIPDVLESELAVEVAHGLVNRVLPLVPRVVARRVLHAATFPPGGGTGPVWRGVNQHDELRAGGLDATAHIGHVPAPAQALPVILEAARLVKRELDAQAEHPGRSAPRVLDEIADIVRSRSDEGTKVLGREGPGLEPCRHASDAGL